MSKPYDPRLVCNLILDCATPKRKITNISLQKILYFCHGFSLIGKKKPLVAGYFEAWQHGPVHPTAYKSFKAAGREPITFRATSKDPLTGREKALIPPTDMELEELVQKAVSSLADMRPFDLVNLSHAKGSPWDFVTERAKTAMVFGMRIPDSLIIERFKHHKLSLSNSPPGDELNGLGEDAPFHQRM